MSNLVPIKHLLKTSTQGNIFKQTNCRFMEIQQAYETLSDIKTKRATINSKQQNANQDEQQTNHEEL